MATAKSIAATQLLVVNTVKQYAPQPTNNGARTTRHNTARSWLAVTQFLANGPQSRQAINNMLTAAYNHGCFVTYLLNNGALVPAPAGSVAGSKPAKPQNGINTVARQAVVSTAAMQQANATNAAILAALSPAQLAKLKKQGII